MNVPSYSVADVNDDAVGSYHSLVLQSMEAFVAVIHGSLCKGRSTDFPDSSINEAEHRTMSSIDADSPRIFLQLGVGETVDISVEYIAPAC